MGVVTRLIASAGSWQAGIVSRFCSGWAPCQLPIMGFYGIYAQNFPTKQGIIGRIRQFREAQVLAPLSYSLADFLRGPMVGGSVA